MNKHLILTSPVYYYDKKENKRSVKDDRYQIVEFVDRFSKEPNLANYITQASYLYNKVKSIKYHYDNWNKIIVFSIETKINCSSKLIKRIIAYVNNQINDGWAEDGIMLVSTTTHKLKDVFVGEAKLYNPIEPKDYIIFDVF